LQVPELLVSSRYASLAREGVFPLGLKLALPPVQTAPGDAQIVFDFTGAFARGLP